MNRISTKNRNTSVPSSYSQGTIPTIAMGRIYAIARIHAISRIQGAIAMGRIYTIAIGRIHTIAKGRIHTIAIVPNTVIVCLKYKL